MERIVVTGATGNIGTALLRCLGGDARWTVTGVARRLPADREPYGQVDWVPCDVGGGLARDNLAKAMAGAAAVVHLAWAINPLSSDPPMRRTNVDGTANVLWAAAEAGVRHVVCASSIAAYRPAGRWQSVSEDWDCDGVPRSAYSQGKAALERQLDRFAADQPTITVTRIRPCAVVQYDAGAQFDRWLLSPVLPGRLLGRRWLPLPFWHGLRAQLVHSADVAEAIRLILAGRHAGAFNLAGDGTLDAKALAGGIGGALVPIPLPVLLAGSWATWRIGLQPVHPGWLRLADQAPLVDTRRARGTLGWQPRHTAADAFDELVRGMRAGAGTAAPPLAPRRAHGLSVGRPRRQAQ